MKLRVKITKQGNVRFISHLEYSKTIMRALKRAKLPVAYSQGFNPHMKISLASALGLGISSIGEYLDVELTEPVCPQKAMQTLNDNLPPSIRILQAVMIEKQGSKKLMAMLTSASYKIVLDDVKQDKIIQAIDKYNSSAEVLFVKKTAPNKKQKQIDLKYYVTKIDYNLLEGNIELYFDSKIFPEGTIKPQDILQALQENSHLDVDVQASEITRLDLYTGDREKFL